jgi:hypothetical protein
MGRFKKSSPALTFSRAGNLSFTGIVNDSDDDLRLGKCHDGFRSFSEERVQRIA